MLKIATLTFNPYGENTYVIYDSGQSLECIIIDAGCYNDKEQQTLRSFIQQHNLRPIMALNTHGHIDHVCGVEYVKRQWGVPFAIHSLERQILEMNTCYAEQMGFTFGSVPEVDIDLSQKTSFVLGDNTLDIINTPGHTPGGVSIYCADQKVLFTGDTLFKESIGRTDLPGGDYPTLMESIFTQIVPLGSEVSVFAGHGPSTNIGHELNYNPFVMEAAAGEVNYKVRNEN